jgi:hypothetical protein
MTADNVIGIFTSRAMKERGRYQIQFMKTRSSSGVGQKVDLEFNVDTLRINDLGEEEDNRSLNQGGGKTSNNGPAQGIIAGLRRTSSVTTSSNVDEETGEIFDPTKGISVPKVRADVGGAKIRSMLASLNSEKD